MNLSLEAYIYIARDITAKEDLASLCRVSKGFRKAAERILYNTLHIRHAPQIQRICNTLASSPRLAAFVDAVSIDVSNSNSDSESFETSPPDERWDLVARALQQMRRLRFLNVTADDSAGIAQAWVLDGCAFQLRTFHCEFSWDDHLVAFLNTQHSLTDLYILDFQNDTRNRIASLTPQSLPKLSILECTFMEAAIALANNRSLSRLKTCFSASEVIGKRAEFIALVRSLRKSRRSLRALDIADSKYSSDFSLETLARINEFLSSSHLRYLGTLSLPVDGRERTEFYGLLMRLHRLHCVELEVTDWDPPPMSPAALRALMYELRLYCPSVTTVIFVYDSDRVVMKVEEYKCVLEQDASPDLLWREV